MNAQRDDKRGERPDAYVAAADLMAAREALAEKIEALQDDGSEGVPWSQDELDMLVQALRGSPLSHVAAPACENNPGDCSDGDCRMNGVCELTRAQPSAIAPLPVEIRFRCDPGAEPQIVCEIPTFKEAQRQIGLASDMLKSCVGAPFTASERDDCQMHLLNAFSIIRGLARTPDSATAPLIAAAQAACTLLADMQPNPGTNHALVLTKLDKALQPFESAPTDGRADAKE